MPKTQCRPGDVVLDLGSGRTLVDVTIASPFAAASQVSTSTAGFPAAAAATAYDCKVIKWRALLGDSELGQEHESIFFPADRTYGNGRLGRTIPPSLA